jgi:predicted amino acid-binding ACT domain protein
MMTLVITVVGDDRAGLVASLADIVDAHGGNWETSEMAELAGAFAGIVEVSVSTDRADDLRRRDLGVGAAFVLDDDGLAPVLVQLLADSATNDVGGAACRERDGEVYGLRRICGGLLAACGR